MWVESLLRLKEITPFPMEHMRCSSAGQKSCSEKLLRGSILAPAPTPALVAFSPTPASLAVHALAALGAAVPLLLRPCVVAALRLTLNLHLRHQSGGRSVLAVLGGERLRLRRMCGGRSLGRLAVAAGVGGGQSASGELDRLEDGPVRPASLVELDAAVGQRLEGPAAAPAAGAPLPDPRRPEPHRRRARRQPREARRVDRGLDAQASLRRRRQRRARRGGSRRRARGEYDRPPAALEEELELVARREARVEAVGRRRRRRAKLVLRRRLDPLLESLVRVRGGVQARVAHAVEAVPPAGGEDNRLVARALELGVGNLYLDLAPLHHRRARAEPEGGGLGSTRRRVRGQRLAAAHSCRRSSRQTAAAVGPIAPRRRPLPDELGEGRDVVLCDQVEAEARLGRGWHLGGGVGVREELEVGRLLRLAHDASDRPLLAQVQPAALPAAALQQQAARALVQPEDMRALQGQQAVVLSLHHRLPRLDRRERADAPARRAPG
mmetsp:Transcript_13298/g.42491  ORF Transcript_13298/g.42491 Transcript_13298/m.42491 type:complete len:495 (+) Transcript_13298:88-1572(+)